MNRRNLAAILMVIMIMASGCIEQKEPEEETRDIEDFTIVEYAMWVVSMVTWDDVVYLVTQGSREALELAEWFIKMMIIADANQETNT
jgi:hypothetical protein